MIWDKVLLHIEVPIANMGYDMYVPRSISVFHLQQALSQVFYELSNGMFRPCESTILWDPQKGMPLSAELPIEKTGLHSGDTLLVI